MKQGIYDLKNQLSEMMNLLNILITKYENVLEDVLMQYGIIGNRREYERGRYCPAELWISGR